MNEQGGLIRVERQGDGPSDDLAPDERASMENLRRALDSLAWPVQLSLNANRRILISLRGSRREGLRVSVHRALLARPEALADLPRWVATGGRLSPVIARALDEVGRSLRDAERRQRPQLLLQPLMAPLDLEANFERIHRLFFAHLTRPPVRWGRKSNRSSRRRIRFAAYSRRPPSVIVNPRLDQPWVAALFVDFVLYHELCHHAQACAPVRGERAHSVRFKRWERNFPQYDLAVRWQRENLDRFLDD